MFSHVHCSLLLAFVQYVSSGLTARNRKSFQALAVAVASTVLAPINSLAEQLKEGAATTQAHALSVRFEGDSLAAFNIGRFGHLPCIQGPVRIDVSLPAERSEHTSIKLNGKLIDRSITLTESGPQLLKIQTKTLDGTTREQDRFFVIGKGAQTRGYPVAGAFGLFERDLEQIRLVRAKNHQFRTSRNRQFLDSSAYLFGKLTTVEGSERTVRSPLVFQGHAPQGQFAGGLRSNWRVMEGTFVVPAGVSIIDNIRRVPQLDQLCRDMIDVDDGVTSDASGAVHKNIDIPVPTAIEEVLDAPAGTTEIGVIPAAFSITNGGAAQYIIPIRVPPGRAGMQPNLSVIYTSGHRDSFLGTGFQLTGLSSIARCPRQIGADGQLRSVDYSAEDRFCLDGVRLVAINGAYGANNTEYRTEEESFSRITSLSSQGVPEPERFIVEMRNGEIRHYGRTEACEPLPTDAPNPCDGVSVTRQGRTAEWRLKEVLDRHGNAVIFDYDVHLHRPAGSASLFEAYEVLPSAIHYTAHLPSNTAPQRSIEFDYIDRVSPLAGYLSGRLIRKTQLLNSIRSLVDGEMVTEYRFSYQQPPDGRVIMTSVTECAGDEVCKPPTEFEWSRREAGFGEPTTLSHSYPLQWENGTVISFQDYLLHQAPLALDVDGNGTDDLVFQTHETWQILFSSPGPIDADSFSLVDTGEPAWAYKEINHNFLGPDQEFADYSFNSYGLPLDYNNDNRIDLFLPGLGQFLLSNGSGFQRHFIFGDQHETLMPTPEHFPVRAFSVDLNGDGLQDYLHCGMTEPINASPLIQWRYHFQEGDGFGNAHLLTDVLEGNYRDCGTTNIRTMDMNGDGATEILMALDGDSEFTAIDFTTEPPRLIPTGLPNKTFTNSQNSPVRFRDKILDINGDGLADVLMVRPDDSSVVGFDGGVVRAWINTGHGFVGGENGLPAIEGDESHFSQLLNHSRSYDYDGDGMKDLFIATPDDPDHPDGPGRWKILKATAQLSDFEDIDASAFGFRNAGWPEFPYEGGNVRHQLFADVNGDFVPDLIHGQISDLGPPAFSNFMVREGRGQPFFGITKIREGQAGLLPNAPDRDDVWTYEISYGPLIDVYSQQLPHNQPVSGCHYPVDCSRPNSLVVTAHRETVVPGMPLADGASPVATIRSFNHYYYSARRDRHGRGSLGFAAHRFEESNGPSIVDFFDNHTYLSEGHIYPLRGRMVRRVTDIDLNDGEGGSLPYRVETHIDYETVTSGIRHFSYPSRHQLLVLRDSGLVTLSSTSVRAVDEYGNITERRRSFGFSGDDVETTTSTYYNDADDWLIGKLATRTTENRVLGSSKTRTFAYSYDSAGSLQSIVREPDNPELMLTSTFETDLFGNMTSLVQTDGAGESRQTLVEYDDEESIFPVAVSRSGGTVTSRYDRRFGLVSEETEPGGFSVSYAFDAFGRLVSISRPTGERTFIIRERVEDVSRGRFYERINTQTLKGSKTLQTLDHRQNQRLLLHAGVFGETYATTIHHNRDRRPIYISRPYALGQTESVGTIITYDELGREIGRTSPAGRVTTTFYDGLTIKRQDTRGNVTEYKVNDRGQIIDVLDPPLGDTSIRGRTQYIYGPFGFLGEVRREQQLNTRLITDAYGRVRFRHDRDTGFSQYQYNGFDEVIQLTDDNGDLTNWSYDDFGRMVLRSDKDGKHSCAYGSASGGNGLLNYCSSPDGVSTYYDYHSETGLPIRETQVIQGHTVSEENRFDAYGRLVRARIIYDNEEVFDLAYGYSNQGVVAKVIDHHSGEVYWKALSADADGNITQESHSNGAITTRTFTPELSLLASIKTESNNQVIQYLEYKYDENQNLKRRADVLEGIQQRFNYDELNRLTSDEVCPTSGDTCSMSSYEYDRRGNIKHKSDIGDFYYTGHKVVLAGDQPFTYDDIGNQIGRNGVSVSFSSFSKPRRIIGQDFDTQIVYDAHGRRAHKVMRDKKRETIYFGSQYRRDVSEEGEVNRLFVHAAGRVVAAVRASSGSRNIVTIHEDALGSTDVLSDEDGNSITKLRFDPFGRYRGTSWDGVADNAEMLEAVPGFTGHEHDVESGLIDMKGRVYDPEIGRFLSPDPFVQAPFFGENLNRYSYVFNNPTSLSDPSGFQAITISEQVDVSGGVGAYYDYSAGQCMTTACTANDLITEQRQGDTGGFESQVTTQLPESSGWYRYYNDDRQVWVNVAYEGENETEFDSVVRGDLSTVNVAVQRAIDQLGPTVTGGVFSVGPGAVSSLSSLGGFVSRFMPAARASAPKVVRWTVRPDTVTVYRVESFKNMRLASGGGGVTVVGAGKAKSVYNNLWLNFSDEAHAYQSLVQRLGLTLKGAEATVIKAVKVPRSFLNRVRANAVPETARAAYPNNPVRSADPFPDQFGLPKNWIEEFERAIINVTRTGGN